MALPNNPQEMNTISTPLRGLKAIQEKLAAEEAERENRKNRKSDGPGKFLRIKDGDAVKLRFLQEMDEDSPNFNEANDLGVSLTVHANPDDFRRSAQCTAGEPGGCWACEKHDEDWSAGWGQKNKYHINALVDNGTDDKFVAVLVTGVGPKSQIWNAIVDKAEDAEEGNTITDTWWSFKRKGDKKDNTNYLLQPKPTVAKESVEDYTDQLHDLNGCVPKFPYEKQELYYLGGQSVTAKAEAPVAEVPEGEKVSNGKW